MIGNWERKYYLYFYFKTDIIMMLEMEVEKYTRPFFPRIHTIITRLPFRNTEVNKNIVPK